MGNSRVAQTAIVWKESVVECIKITGLFLIHQDFSTKFKPVCILLFGYLSRIQCFARCKTARDASSFSQYLCKLYCGISPLFHTEKYFLAISCFKCRKKIEFDIDAFLFSTKLSGAINKQVRELKQKKILAHPLSLSLNIKFTFSR
jgi:hypothetical protein